MKRFYKIFRAVLLSLIGAAIIIPTLFYIALSLPVVQNIIRETCEKELSEKLGVEVSISDIKIMPFNKITLENVSMKNNDEPILYVERLGAGISIFDLIRNGKIVVNYAEIIGMDASVSRETPDSPLNIQPIIDALSSKDENKPPTRFEFRVNTLVIRRSKISYDVLSEPQAPEGHFDKNHISINDLRADIHLPLIKNDDISVDIKRLAFEEKSGLSLISLKGNMRFTDIAVQWNNLDIEFTKSHLLPEDGELYYCSIPSPGESPFSFVPTLDFALLPGTVIYPPDFAPFVGTLSRFDEIFNLDLKLSYLPNNLTVENLDLHSTENHGWSLKLSDATVSHPLSPEYAVVNVPNINIDIDRALLDLFPHIENNSKLRERLPSKLSLTASLKANALKGEIDVKANVDEGRLAAKAGFSRDSIGAPIKGWTKIETHNINLAKTLSNDQFGHLNLKVEGQVVYDGRLKYADGTLSLSNFTFRDFIYDDFYARLNYDNHKFHIIANLDDGGPLLNAEIQGSDKRGERFLHLIADINDFRPFDMHLTKALEGYSFSSAINADLTFDSQNPFEGSIDIENFKAVNPDGDVLQVDNFVISCDTPNLIEITSDFLSGTIDGTEGNIALKSLATDLKHIVMAALPVLDRNVSGGKSSKQSLLSQYNDFNFEFKLDEPTGFAEFFKTKLKLLGKIDISGKVSSKENQARLNINAPFIVLNGKKYVKDINFAFRAVEGNDSLDITAKMPLRRDVVNLNLKADAGGDRFNVGIDWKDLTDTVKLFKGGINLSGNVFLTENDEIASTLSIKGDSIVFNNAEWDIETTSPIFLAKNFISVNELDIKRIDGEEQSVTIAGIASANLDESLTVDIKNINLGYIFKTLEINNAQLGGIANGRVNASGLLAETAVITTDEKGIRVKNVSFNDCVLGDAVVTSFLDNEEKVVELNGKITQANGHTSTISGQIFPLEESLNIIVDADHAPLGFMNYYMSAFASDVKGVGSGRARVFGSFKDMDLEGKVWFDNLSMKLDFTNTTYTATDTITIEPGKIILDNIEIHDVDGNKAKVAGVITHNYFRDPKFDINITDAHDFLVYNQPISPDEYWYGKIYANGNANVNNVEGPINLINIKANIHTAPRSTFTYILTEQEIAEEYSFIRFRDKAQLQTETIQMVDDELTRLEMLRKSYENASKKGPDSESHYLIDLNIGITPEGEVNLIMDPDAGDRIRSHGKGNLRVVYDSSSDNLEIYGEYKLDEGFYNFTLQDIIIKDFKIEEGSTISFPDGDPYKTRLNIKAYYELTANLSDLDDSFLQDKELNRTNIRVRAILRVTGSIEAPELSLDLEFPTLTEETVRKIRSIISTEEMINRQIIYLLALNRFYTPDYMSTTKGSELVSFASSTISSQLSNMLRQLTDVVAISPSLRSSKGDFTDVEFDVALSSSLLNNRLLLNGNFGYRDKTLNTNQFIGDFDLEYLLNRQGSIRVKAYNRFNDQNYYIRTAETTQGVGVMFKTDFDDVKSLVRSIFSRKKKKKVEEETTETDK